MCVVLAACIWVINSLNNQHVMTIRIPVRYELHFNTASRSQVPDFLELDVKARGFTLLEFLSVSRRYKINPFENPSQFNDTVLSSMDAVWPLVRSFGKEIEITRISPKQFFLSDNKAFSKKVAIKGNFRIRFKPSYLASGPSIFYPDSVFIFSSAKIPAELTEIFSENIVFENADKNIFRKLALRLPKGDYQLSQQESWLYVPVEQGTEISLDAPIISINKFASEIFIPNTVKVTCLVPLSKYSLTKSALFSFETQASSLNRDKAIIRLKRSPYWATKIRWEPSTVHRYTKKLN